MRRRENDEKGKRKELRSVSCGKTENLAIIHENALSFVIVCRKTRIMLKATKGH